MTGLRQGRGGPLTVGFTLIGRGNWTGGETYLRNMLGMIDHELRGKLAPKLFLTPEQAEKLGGSLDRFLAAPPIIDPVFGTAGRGGDLARALVLGNSSASEAIYRREGVDVVFESATFLGRSFGLPVLSWIPDFQHRRLPHLFSRAARMRRDLGFTVQAGTNRTIMLSSEDARADCERFYPASHGKTRVVRFSIDFDPTAHLGRRAEMMAAHGLPERFFFLPNQFWVHKNHRVLVEALGLLKEQGTLDEVLPVILTGRPEDPRNPGYFRELQDQVRARGLESRFRYLGLVPYDHVFGLAGACDALINPSLFEGWSTTVEEAKGLGAPMILSDLGIHREQTSQARFFPPNDAQALAGILLDVSRAPAAKRPSAATLVEEQAGRRRAYADAFLAAVDAARLRGAPKLGRKGAGAQGPDDRTEMRL